jgi:hypothetical protein
MVEYKRVTTAFFSFQNPEQKNCATRVKNMVYLWEKNRQKLSWCRQKWRTLLLLLLLFVLFSKEEGEAARLRSFVIRATWCQGWNEIEN